MGAPRPRETGTGISVSRHTPAGDRRDGETRSSEDVSSQDGRAFTKFVGLEDDLLALLRQSIERDRTILATMTGRAA